MIHKESHILLTGATGFLGAYVLRTLLKHNYQNITCTYRDTSNFSLIQDVKGAVNWCKCDLTDELELKDAIKESEIVIHIAAKVSLSRKNRSSIMQMNTEVTANMINASLDQNIKKFIFVTSVAAFGIPKNDEIIHEATEWVDRPENTIYSISKQLAEREVIRGVAEGLNAAIVSPAMIIGAGVWSSSTVSIIKSVYKGLPFYPLGSVGVVDVRDVALIILKVLEKQDISGEKFIASAENWDHKKIIEVLSEEFKNKPPTKSLSPFIAKLSMYAASFVEVFLGEQAIVNAESIKLAQRKFTFDNSKSIQQLDLNYRDIKSSFHEIANSFKKSFLQGESFGLLDI